MAGARVWNAQGAGAARVGTLLEQSRMQSGSGSDRAALGVGVRVTLKGKSHRRCKEYSQAAVYLPSTQRYAVGGGCTEDAWLSDGAAASSTSRWARTSRGGIDLPHATATNNGTTSRRRRTPAAIAAAIARSRPRSSLEIELSRSQSGCMLAAANLTLHPGGCGFTYHDGTAAWSFNLSSVGHAELRARGSEFDYLLLPCGITTEVCRPSVCSENNASACQPYDTDVPQRGAAIQYGVHSATPVAPRLPQQRCFEQGTSPPVEAPCTRTCNVLAPAGRRRRSRTEPARSTDRHDPSTRALARTPSHLHAHPRPPPGAAPISVPSHNATVLTPHDSSWSLSEWSTHRYNFARPRLSFAPQQPAWFLRPNPTNWSFPQRLPCTDPGGHSKRTLHIEFVCAPDAVTPELSPPPSDAACEVSLTVRSAAPCFAFEWRAGEWGACDFVHLVRHRPVQCVEVLPPCMPSAPLPVYPGFLNPPPNPTTPPASLRRAALPP